MKHGTIAAYCNKKSPCRCEKCRASMAAYQRERRRLRPDIRAKEDARNKLYFARVKQFVKDQKDGNPCMDCGVAYPFFVMQYDHRGDDVKVFILSQAPSIAKAKDEIAKCDLVCANCHAIRTHNRRLTLAAKRVKL